jgi:hypothetical protein
MLLRNNSRLRILLVQVIGLIVLLCLLQYCTPLYVTWFTDAAFPALQVARCALLNYIPFSIGDVLYVIFLLYLLCVLAQEFRSQVLKDRLYLAMALLRMIRFFAILGIVLQLTWTALYTQKPLSEQMDLTDVKGISPQMLLSFDSVLIERMNTLAPQLYAVNFVKIDSLGSHTYLRSFDRFTLHTKSSLFGFALPYLGISGYFNPFSGEAQIDPSTPDFMMPFLVAHEMAHQMGIAAENDANLMAYIQCVASNELSFQYAAYFNLWLYLKRTVHQLDPVQARRYEARLNAITLQHSSLLKQRDLHYHTFIDDATTFIFDRFLKLNQQHEGIASYKSVVYTALAWEIKKRTMY